MLAYKVKDANELYDAKVDLYSVNMLNFCGGRRERRGTIYLSDESVTPLPPL